MTREIIAELGGHTADVIAFVTTATPSDFGATAPMMMRHMNRDAVALRLVQDVADEVGSYIARLHDLGESKIALVGGMA